MRVGRKGAPPLVRLCYEVLVLAVRVAAGAKRLRLVTAAPAVLAYNSPPFGAACCSLPGVPIQLSVSCVLGNAAQCELCSPGRSAVGVARAVCS